MPWNGAMNNKLLIAAAGSGKTTHLVKEALSKKSERILFLTYTESNEAEIRRKIVSKEGYIPSRITVQTWFSFLLRQCVRPYQSVLHNDIHEVDIGFYLTSEKSGKRIDSEGNQILNGAGKPMTWGEETHFLKHYFTNEFKIYSDKISKFALKANTGTKGEIVDRLIRQFDCIFIDEVQDLAGYDLDLVKLLFATSAEIVLAGDPRQVTYLTHPTTKHKKYADGGIKRFVENELGKKIACKVDETTLNTSHRNNQLICDYSAQLYPDLPVPQACECNVCRTAESSHNGIFLVRKEHAEAYLKKYQPTQLRWSNSVRCNEDYPRQTFGNSKGATFDRCLIYATSPMKKWLKNNNSPLGAKARAKFYVGLTRARYSTAIVYDYSPTERIDGVSLWAPESL